MRRFGTQGRVYPDKHYVVARAEETADFIDGLTVCVRSSIQFIFTVL